MYIQAHGLRIPDGLGWFIDTRISTAKTPAGHEILTERAARGVITNRPDLTALIDGTRRPDLADPNDHIKLGEQRRHFLRSMNQTSLNAWSAATNHLRTLHQSMMASTSRADELRFIGEALHLIQDSFAPAHVERDPRSGDILNIRVYDPKAAPGEHVFLTDPRDAIFTARPPTALALGAREAITAGQEYLKMALMHLQLKQLPFVAPAQQTKRDLNAFIGRRLWLRFPNLRVGSQGDAVSELHSWLNGWLAVNAPTLGALRGSTFDSDTHSAVLEFQKAMRLTRDGMVGRETWKKLLLP